MGEFALGQPVSRFEDPRLLRGGGRYVDDMVLPRTVFGHVLRSPHAHARISRIDTTAARVAPGVLAVLTGADWEASGCRDLPSAAGNKGRDGTPAYRPRYPVLVKSRLLGRRLCRICRRRDPPSGGRRRRADRGRVRAAAGGRLYG
jgi:carbon-monoxide dehydrogenase large subunit